MSTPHHASDPSNPILHYECWALSDAEVGDDVMVLCPGLQRLRELCPGLPPNHFGRVQFISDGTCMVEFLDENGTYEHSQVAPYPMRMVVKRLDGKESRSP